MNIKEVNGRLVGPLGDNEWTGWINEAPPINIASLGAYVLLGKVAQAVSDTTKIRVSYLDRWDEDSPVEKQHEGIARHVVASNHEGFARMPWAPKDRLRITTGFEWFLPLEDILDLWFLDPELP